LLASECRSVIEYRVFRNTDPPRLAEVWRSQVGHFELMQPMSMAVFERYVLSKPIFDRQGLIIAHEAEKAIGFAHAGFGPSAGQNGLSTESGVTSLVMLRPDVESEVAGELLARSEHYLRSRGATQIYGGGHYPLSPFYYGLYGGSEFSGVLQRDPRMQSLFHDHGYQEMRRTLVFHRELCDFRPAVDRQQLKIRRQFTVETIVDPPTTTWWEAVIFEPFDRTRCLLVPKDGGPALASVNFWNMETMIGTLGVHAVGIVGLEVAPNQRRQGLAKFLLGEALRQLHAQHVALAEVHVAEENATALTLFGSLGFNQVDSSILYCKDCRNADK
jgi:ribosomal protein S18 acetylase RimI-like enzyme